MVAQFAMFHALLKHCNIIIIIIITMNIRGLAHSRTRLAVSCDTFTPAIMIILRSNESISDVGG